MHEVEFSLITFVSIFGMLIWIGSRPRRRWLRQVEQRLLESQEDYRSLFEHNPYAVYSCDIDGRVTSLNPSFHKLTGYTLDDLNQRPTFSLVIEHDKARLGGCFQEALQGQSQHVQTIVVNKAGEHVHVDITYQPMYRSNGIVGVYAIAQDITSHKVAERELWDLQEMFASFINNTSDALFIFRMDGTVLHVNRAFEETYGWTAKELIGRPIPAVVPAYLNLEKEEMIRTVRSGKVVSSTETVRQRKDGSLLDVNVTVAPIRNAEGEVVAAAGVSRDISKHKQMTRQLIEAQHRFESLVQNTADAISMVDLDGTLQMVNPAWENLYGWTAQEVTGKKSPALTQWDDDKFSRDSRRIRAGNVLKREAVRKRKDGTDVEVSLTESPIFSSDGQVVSIAVIAKDLTEFRKTEEVVLRADKLTLAGELAAGIAHEIRNPLTAIQGFLQLMRSHFEPRYLDVLLPEVKRINDITDEFLLLSKPQTEVRDLADIAGILDDVLTLMASEANLYSISITTKIASNLPPLLCAANQIKQAIMNLIKNSIEAMATGGSIAD